MIFPIRRSVQPRLARSSTDVRNLRLDDGVMRTQLVERLVAGISNKSTMVRLKALARTRRVQGSATFELLSIIRRSLRLHLERPVSGALNLDDALHVGSVASGVRIQLNA